jgi:hypothetical protein
MESDIHELSGYLVSGKVKEFSDCVTARSPWPREQVSNLLLMLIGSHDRDWLPILVKAGADVNFVGDEGQTPLSACVHAWAFPDQAHGPSAKQNALINALELMTLGSNPNSKYMNLFSVTALAVTLNSPELALAFLLAGAALDQKEPDEYSSDTLRDVLRKSKLPWSSNLLAIVDRMS